MAKKKLNIGMVGYGFMGRAHSNAWRKVSNFFDTGYQPVLKAAAARNPEKLKAFAETWGYESIETDWRKLVARKDIDAIDICTPNDTPRRDRHRRRQGRQDGALREAARPHRQGRPADGARRSRRPASPTWSGTITAASRR